MNKKLCLLMTFIIASTMIFDNVKADVFADGGGGTASGSISDANTCIYGSYSGLSLGNLNAVRMSIVDSAGNRVAGTNSIDLTSKGSGTNLTQIQITIKNDLPANAKVNRLDGMHTRTEIVNGAGGVYLSDGTYSIYYWNKLPWFNTAGSTNGGAILNTYFKTNFATTDIDDMKRIFSLMNYNGYNDKSIYGNHYILVEPIFYMYTTYPNPASTTGTCRVTKTFYYGTGTELFKMISMSPFYNFGSVNGTFQDIGTRVHDTENVAGLRETDSIMYNKSSMKSYALSNYGLASMHVWMTELLEHTDPGCTDKNGRLHKYSEDKSLSRLDFDEKYCPNTYCRYNGVDYFYKSFPNMTEQQVRDTYCKPGNNICPTNPKVETKSECDPNTGNTIVVEDTSDWNCIFNQINKATNTYEFESSFYAPNGETQFAGLNGSNPYCTVACRESVTSNFPSSFTVLAGGRFTIGNTLEGAATMGPITTRGVTTCKTGYNKDTNSNTINIEKFQSDYAAANVEVAKTWDLYQIELAKQRSIQGTHTQTLIQTGVHACSDTEIDYNNCVRQGTVSCMVSGTSHNNGGWGPNACNPNQSDATICNENAKNACGPNGLSDCAKNNPWFSCNVTRNSSGCAEYGRKPKTTEACGEGNYEHDGHREWQKYEYYGTMQSYRGTYYSWSGQDHYIGSSDGKHGDTHYLTANVAGAKANYENAMKYRDGLLQKIKSCNNFQRTYSEFDPAITFVYNDDYYKKDYVLAKLQTTTSYTTYENGQIKYWSTSGYSNYPTYVNDDANIYGASAGIFTYKCGVDGNPCSGDYVAYPTNRSVTQVTDKSYSYTLPNNVYQYIAKNGTSYNTIEEIIEKVVFPGDITVEEIEKTKVKKLNGSSLPVSYSKGDCIDNYYIDYYYLNGQKNLFGINQKFLKYDKVTSYGTTTNNGVQMSSNLSYKCNYNIVQDFYENQITTNNNSENNTPNEDNERTYYYYEDSTPSTETQNHNITKRCNECPNCKKTGDINIIYRPISLEDPFPGESGNVRTPGANWLGIVKNTNKDFVNSYITNNRNVKTDDVYKLKPIYEFVLTPTNMRRIRQYNNKQKDDYNDNYTLECYKNGEYCQSRFLKEGKGAGYFEFTKENANGGTCYGANLTDWDTCRYTMVGGS